MIDPDSPHRYRFDRTLHKTLDALGEDYFWSLLEELSRHCPACSVWEWEDISLGLLAGGPLDRR